MNWENCINSQFVHELPAEPVFGLTFYGVGCQYEAKTKEKYNDFLKVLFVFAPYIYDKYKDIYDAKKHNHFGYKLPIDGDDVMQVLRCGSSPKIKEILDK